MVMRFRDLDSPYNTAASRRRRGRPHLLHVARQLFEGRLPAL